MKKTNALSTVVIVVICITLLLPLVLTCVYSFCENWTELLPEYFTLEFYATLFNNSDFIPSLLRTIVICFPPILISVVCISFALYTAIVYFPALEKIVQVFSMAPQTIRGVILAIPLLTLYAGSNGPFGNRTLLLVMAYAITILPYVFNTIRNSMYAINVHQLIEAAEVLGMGKFRAFVTIVIPCMKSGILVASLTSMAIIFGDFAVIKIIAGGKWRTGMMFLFANRTLSGHLQSAIIMVMFIIVLIISFIGLSLQNKEQKQEVYEEVKEK